MGLKITSSSPKPHFEDLIYYGTVFWNLAFIQQNPSGEEVSKDDEELRLMHYLGNYPSMFSKLQGYANWHELFIAKIVV